MADALMSGLVGVVGVVGVVGALGVVGPLAGCHRDPGAGSSSSPLAVPSSAAAMAAEVMGDQAGLPFYRDADLTAEWHPPSVTSSPDFHRVAPFSFHDQRGERVSREDLGGHIYVANFFFSSCKGICPKMLTNLRRIQDAFATDDAVRLVSHTVVPSSDTVEVLGLYARANGVRDGKWHLLTGSREAIYELARRSYFAEKRVGLGKGSDEFLHTENMFLVDRGGRIRGVYNATLPLEADRVIEDIRALEREGG